MIDKRLIGTVSESKRYIFGNVALQWCGLIANIGMIFAITGFIGALAAGQAASPLLPAAAVLAALAVRFGCSLGAGRMGYLSSKAVKRTLREKIYAKLLALGPAYKEQVSSAEIVQVTVEGVEQLETYFGAYLPQFFYSMLAPLTLFIVLAPISLPAALVLLVCVPLIPVAIAAVQTFAKKLLANYWGQYAALGDTFLENLQGLTTLKIYRSDEFKSEEMDRESEKFRRITMKVLTMQLNSVTIMDLVAYGGAALGIIVAVVLLKAGSIDLVGALRILLLAADFFIPMRMLGSYFHIAMNGMAASDKIFKLLDLPEAPGGDGAVDPARCAVLCRDVHFAYDETREILHGVDFACPMGSFVAVVGESGCGKSTLAALLTGKNRGYTGSVTIGGVELRELSSESLLKNVTYVSYNSYLFKGTVRENLLPAAPGAADAALWDALERARLADFLRSEGGLDFTLTEQGSNLSGGQRQRLAFARALLHDSPLYIFDEATSNIDVESETDLVEQIQALAKTKTVIMISHRLANAVHADEIYALEDGAVAGHGKHGALLAGGGCYKRLWDAQQTLEQFAGKEARA